jgi:hypothetical protein
MITPKSEMVSREEAVHAVEQMTRRAALLYVAFARALVDELGEEHGREVIRQAIWQYGAYIGAATHRAVEAQGLEPTPENFAAGSDLPPLGFQTETIVVEGETRSRIYNCVFARTFQEHDLGDLGCLYCQVDPAKMQAYNPSATIIHTRSALRGDDFCELATRIIAKEPPGS